MKTLTEEEFKSKFGEKSVMQMDQINSNRFAGGGLQTPTKRPLADRFTGAIGLGGATDVFGKLIARSTLGAKLTGGDVTANKEFIEAPTGKQVAGAVAQTAVIPAGAALTGGGSLLGQVAAGAGLGYVFDVGADFAEGKEGLSNFKPGAETLAGAAVPVALRGAAMGLRGAGNLAGSATEGIKTAVDAASDAISPTGIGQRAKEFAARFPRAARRVGGFIDEGAEVATRRKTGTPGVISALDEGVPMETIDFVQKFDSPTRKAAVEMMDLADGGRGSALPQTVPGRVASEQLDMVQVQRKKIGQQIGEFSDSLSTQKQDVSPSVRNLDSVLSNNDIIAIDGQLSFENLRITPKQQKVLQEMYSLATNRTEMSPKQIHQMDQLFSKLQREARFEGVDDIIVEVPTADGMTETNIYKVFRDVFGQQLDEIAEQAGRGDIRQLNRDYRTLRNLQDNVEDTIVKQSRREGVTPDPTESASVALRRLFSNAQSASEYQEIYNQLDATSRSLGYNGARADTLMDLYLTDLKPLYPETVKKASLEGGFRGAFSSVIDKITELGAPDTKEKRQALRKLLQEAATE